MPTYTQTTTYDAAMLRYPTVSGLTISGSTVANIDIPLDILSFSVPTRKTAINVFSGMPHVAENYSIGGLAVGVGTSELAKVTLEGHIDTPTTASGNFQLPDIVLDGIRYTYADLIGGFIDGRLNGWQRLKPTYFRDHLGRQFNSPAIIDFSASYVEAVPARTNFSMVLVLNG